jgi:ABC-2 type transport system ATP-binding protein
MTGAGAPVLEARDVHKAYGRHRVLNGAALTVQPGQLVAVVGENGAGKSTLLKILAGTLAADRGQVRLTGTLGCCPQEPVVNENLTVGQHLAYFAAAYRLPSLRRAGALADLLGFAEFRNVTAGALSGGTRQKLNLTLALLHDPDVLCWMSPTRGSTGKPACASGMWSATCAPAARPW